MKITDIKTYCVQAQRRNWVFLEVETDAGLTGAGEVSSTGFAKTMEAAVWDFKRLLIGENPLEIERLWEYLYRRKFWRQDLLLCTALSGIEMALWDIKGKECGKPVYELLGGPTRDKVKAYANYWFMGAKKVSDYAKMAEAAVENGYKALKWSPFGSSAHSVTNDQLSVIVECVKQVREAVGPNIDLLMDAHGRFNLPTARRVLNAIEEYNPFFVEEPLPPENIDALVALKNSVKVPLATGERLVTRYQFTDLLAKFAVDYIQPDALHCGGIAETRKIAAMAEAHYIPLIPHNPGGPISTAAMIHVAASIPNFEVLEYINVPGRENILKEPLVWKEGYFELPTRPGLGVELNHAEFERFPYEPRDLDHYAPVRDIQMG